MRKIVFVFVAVAVAFSLNTCKSHEKHQHEAEHHHEGEEHEHHHEGHEEGEHEHHEHDHEGAAPVVKITASAQGYEIYAEVTPLVKGEKATALIHLTNLENYKPENQGTLLVEIPGLLDPALKAVPSETKGIFKAAIPVAKTGEFPISFRWKREKGNATIPGGNIKAFASDHEALHHMEEHHQEKGAITYLKEQAWAIEFGIDSVVEGPFHEVIKTSGQILPAQGDEVIVTARHRGTVLFQGKRLLGGQSVRKGAVLLTLSASLLDNNLQQEYVAARAKYEKLKKDWERANDLITDQLITQSAFREVEANYKEAKSHYNTLARFYSKEGERVEATATGFVKECLVKEGQFVEAGQPLVVLTQNKNLILQADVPQKDYARLANVFNASFVTPYNQRHYSIEEMGGRKISYGKAQVGASYFTPVFFEIPNTDTLVPGAFVEVFLKTGKYESALTIPTSAILEEQGSYYVFVQMDGEHYRKQYITPGHSDGQRVKVLSGLSKGDKVVSKGAYQVKMASLSGKVPGHHHHH